MVVNYKYIGSMFKNFYVISGGKIPGDMCVCVRVRVRERVRVRVCVCVSFMISYTNLIIVCLTHLIF